MKIDLKQIPELDLYTADGSIQWPITWFKDGETVYVNAKPFIYRKKDGEQAVLEPVEGR